MDIRIEIDYEAVDSSYYDHRMIKAILRTNEGKAADDLIQFALEEWNSEFPNAEHLVKEAIITLNCVDNYHGHDKYITLGGKVEYVTITGVNFDMAWWTADFFRDTKEFKHITSNMLSRVEPDVDINVMFRMLWAAIDPDKVDFMFHPTEEFAKVLWEDFKLVSLNKDNETLEVWRDFPSGTNIKTIYAWFENEFPIHSVKFTLMKDYSDM